MSKHLMDYEDGETVDCFALVKDASERQTKAGKPFLSLTFADESGELGGMLWDSTADDAQQFKPGVVVHVTGKRDSYRDKPQLNIDEVRVAGPGEPQDPAMFVPHAPESTEQLKSDLRPYILAIHNHDWQRVVNHMLKEHLQDFFVSPAAKTNHHAYAGGLAFHTLSILRLAKAVCGLYEGIDRSLIYAGAILHDLGKTVELSGPVATQYTTVGTLIGHISIIDGEIAQACDALGIDSERGDMMLLRHVVLAHHGLMEYGSPVTPHLLEAEILHRLDELDASIMMVQTATAKVEPGEFTPRLFAMDNRAFYKPLPAELGLTGENEDNVNKK
ncbi:HD domain-containing protein [uncultured Limosilactobacillus sp.]|uniref:3'-5' exoribonuclease YhaM family protein n=1 Tax=uncultured Limosilactobacillus sp. TaxID=2837629 RepID=UPI0025D3072B|nr:HD domain-containing protein [uncultured Limosilactobacillus sp.]